MDMRDLRQQVTDGINEIPIYDLSFDTADDRVHEEADNAVPIYTSDLLEVAANDPDVALDEPEIGSDGTPTGTIAANIYCQLVQHGYEVLAERREAQEEIDLDHEIAEEEYEIVLTAREWVSEAMLDWYDRQRVTA